ncbi:MAG: branched-chain-amino-acid transaminase [Candidatus Omnitrophota bacterium]
MGLKVYVDGKYYEQDQARVSVFDHGLLYGDGVFEGIRSYNGLVFKLEEHIDRLYESAHTIMLMLPMAKKEMIKAVIDTLKLNKLKNAYIRLVVTRGIGDLGLDPRKCRRPVIIIITDKIAIYPQKFYEQGLVIVTVPTMRNLSEAVNPQIKSLNYLNNILAKIEAINAGVEEAIMLNSQGYVAECTGDNIFIIKNGELKTPIVNLGVLNGITRGEVIDIVRKKHIAGFTEDFLTRHDLYNADECFLTGTAAEVIPVVQIDGRKIGDGLPGKTTKLIMKEFQKVTKIKGTRYKL